MEDLPFEAQLNYVADKITKSIHTFLWVSKPTMVTRYNSIKIIDNVKVTQLDMRKTITESKSGREMIQNICKKENGISQYSIM